MEKRWKILPEDATRTANLQSRLQISYVLCNLLVQRGLETFEQCKEYFRPQLSDLHSPWLMKDMQKAVDRLTAAFSNREKILVFGDYDVDGTTSVALLYQFLHRVYSPDLIDFYIPHRYHEGYGISKTGIDYAKERGFSLIISLDCGIKASELISYARTIDIDFIVCDHHLPDNELPPAVAILNPKQPDCSYPYKELCGCGVGFKLISALAEQLQVPFDHTTCYLELVATAIAADIVPITGENRILAYHGLKKINQDPCPGIKALIQLSGMNKELHISHVLFVIAPRVNAAGRMDDARKAVQLFIEKDYEAAVLFAEKLHADNADRKQADLSITEEAVALIELDTVQINKKSTVLFQPHWHKGVVGIVASRLIDRYYRPTIVLTQSGTLVAGSARSVNGFNLYEAIHACREHLIGYGGHFAAAGMTLLPEKVDAFSSMFEEVVASTILPDLLVPELTIDAEVRFTSLTRSFFNIICQMEPFGPGNDKPVFITRGIAHHRFSRIVKDHHIRFVLQQDGIRLYGIGFNLAGKFPLLQLQKPIDVVYTLDENDWNNEKHLQLKVIDFRLSEC
ncbi:MAG: single-stranded-DNA-specific exonuclease RecJ [Williamsia sp.]|nr:single-stranded-DNA-specific exonuclease RecJ [Williamsia sp.]